MEGMLSEDSGMRSTYQGTFRVCRRQYPLHPVPCSILNTSSLRPKNMSKGLVSGSNTVKQNITEVIGLNETLHTSVRP